MANSVGHISVPYPTIEQGLDSAQHVARLFMGLESFPKSHLAAHSWVGSGAILSQVLPANEIGSQEGTVVLSQEERDALHEYTSMRAAGVEIDRDKLVAIGKILLGILLKVWL